MAHVLNQKERNQSFLKFLFFFLLSTLFIVSAVYFDVRVPTKDNEVLRDQVSRYKTQGMAQEKFVKAMDDAKLLIDSLNKPGVNLVYLNQQVAAKIRDMADLQYKDSSMYSRLNKNVLDVFIRYQDVTNNNLKVGDMPQQLEDYKTKLAETQRDLDNTRRDLQVIQKSTNNGF